jgi:hypothetical protein
MIPRRLTRIDVKLEDKEEVSGAHTCIIQAG